MVNVFIFFLQKDTPQLIIPIFLSLSEVGSFCLISFHVKILIQGRRFSCRMVFKSLAFGCDGILSLFVQVGDLLKFSTSSEFSDKPIINLCIGIRMASIFFNFFYNMGWENMFKVDKYANCIASNKVTNFSNFH